MAIVVPGELVGKLMAYQTIVGKVSRRLTEQETLLRDATGAEIERGAVALLAAEQGEDPENAVTEYKAGIENLAGEAHMDYFIEFCQRLGRDLPDNVRERYGLNGR